MVGVCQQVLLKADKYIDQFLSAHLPAFRLRSGSRFISREREAMGSVFTLKLSNRTL